MLGKIRIAYVLILLNMQLNSLLIVLPDEVELDFHKERSMLTSVPNV